MSDDQERDIDHYQMEELELRYAKLAEEKSDLERELIRAKQQLVKNSHAFKCETEALKDELASKDAEIDDKHEQVRMIKEEIRRQQSTIEGLSADNERMKRSTDKLKQDNELMEQQIAKLKNERKIFYERLDGVKRNSEESVEKTRQKERLLFESQSEKRSLEKAVNELKMECQTLSSELEVKTRRVKELEQCVQSDLEYRLTFNANNGKLVDQINELQSIKTLHQQKIDELERERDQLKDKQFEYSRELELKITEARDNTAECESKMADMNNTVSQLSETMDRSKILKQGRRKVNRQIRNSLNYLERVIDSYH